ncbi:MAG: 4Fe-4S dicluster domain-containing protein [Methanosarcinaceae archaeon]|nr:4Fe-4S dicluster domain-containing protein [Methanosarcinaceae archaeon]
MLRILKKTIKTGIVTKRYPKEQDIAPVGFRGKPEIDSGRCTFCGDCVAACPTGVVHLTTEDENREKILTLDYCGCIFCGRCEEVCTHDAIKLTQEYELASKIKEDLITKFRRRT